MAIFLRYSKFLAIFIMDILIKKAYSQRTSMLEVAGSIPASVIVKLVRLNKRGSRGAAHAAISLRWSVE